MPYVFPLIGVPKSLELEYVKEVIKLEELKKMPYVTSVERFAKEEEREKHREEKIMIAKLLLAEGMDINFIAKVTKLQVDDIQE